MTIEWKTFSSGSQRKKRIAGNICDPIKAILFLMLQIKRKKMDNKPFCCHNNLNMQMATLRVTFDASRG